MQKLITMLFILFSFTAHAQWYWQENFEAPYDLNRDKFVIDSTNPGNLWQIGQPHKTVFTSAYSAPNAIVTDTVNTYPGHDTSVFTILHTYMFSNYMFSLRFYYKLDKDAGALAKVEVSGDDGQNWIDPIAEDTTYMFYWGGPKPRLDTSVHTWTKFELNMEDWANAWPGGPNVFPHYRTSDTIMFRFTFASGSVVIPKDGWILDDFWVEDSSIEGYAEQVRRDDMVNIYPNPCKGKLYLYDSENNEGDAKLRICTIDGREVYHGTCNGISSYADLSLPDGIYILRYERAGSYAVKRLVIANK
jgi:hypothetical protein